MAIWNILKAFGKVGSKTKDYQENLIKEVNDKAIKYRDKVNHSYEYMLASLCLSLNKKQVKETNFGLVDRFIAPTGVTTDEQGNTYIASFAENIIYKVDANKNKTYIIDYEWVFSFPIPLNFIYYRAINNNRHIIIIEIYIK